MSGFGPQTPCAQEDEVAQVLASFKALNWENPLSGELLLGFLALRNGSGPAPSPACADDRPSWLWQVLRA